MLYCDKCKVKVKTPNHFCPLCHGTLGGEADQEVYPSFPKIIERRVNEKSVVNLMTFVCICVSIVAYIINRFDNQAFLWSLYVAGAMFYIWLITMFAIGKRRNILKNIVWEELVIGVGLVLWDVATGWRGWSLDYGMPILITIGLVVSMIVKMIKRLPAVEYMIYYIMNIVVSIIPVTLAMTGVFEVQLPSMICGGISLSLLAYLLCFQRMALLEELQKKFVF